MIFKDFGPGRVEQVVVGDFVRMVHHETPEGEIVYGRVVRTFQNPPQPLWHLEFGVADGDFSISATKEHPFFVYGKDWVQAEHLEPGDVLRSASDTPVTLKSKAFDDTPVPVYNFEVEGGHTYFVGESATKSVLVHNDCEWYETAKEAVKNVGNKLADTKQYMADNPPFDSKIIAALAAFDANLTRSKTEMLASFLDPVGTISDAIEDVSQSVAIGREHGVAVGLTRQIGLLQMAEAYYGIEVGSGEPVDPTGSIAEGAGRLGGTAALAAGGITAGKALKAKPKTTTHFPSDPQKFNPEGLVRQEYKNGEIIKWIDPKTKKAKYEWNADTKGGHYHVTPDGKNRIPHPGTRDTHIPPNTIIPK